MLADRRLLRWPNEEQWKTIWLAANAKGYKGGVSAAVHRVAPELLDTDWVGIMGVSPEDGKMMWSEIRVQRSVSPFIEVNQPFTAAQKAAAALQRQVAELAAQHWEVISDGPSGVQLRKPKKMKRSGQVWLGLGLLTLILGLVKLKALVCGLGLVIIAFVIVDYYVYTKPETKFLPRA